MLVREFRCGTYSISFQICFPSLYSNFRSMSKTDSLQEQYKADTQVMASKSRFGFFSILPSHTAAHNEFPSASPHKDADGKVITQPRNIYAGPSMSGSLKKNNFSYVPSSFHGSPYEDPGKHQRKLELEKSKQWGGKQCFKPIKLNKTLMNAPYPYMTPYDPKKDLKNYRNPEGKVITESPNILISLQSKISYNSMKSFKYTECPPQQKKQKVKKEEQETKIQPFKAGNPTKQIFTSHYNTYYDAEIKKKEEKLTLNKSASHEGPFKPSCISKGTPFTPVVYKQEGTGKPKVQVIKKSQNKGVQPFKLTKIEHNSKPCPSIALTKMNLLRVCR